MVRLILKAQMQVSGPTLRLGSRGLGFSWGFLGEGLGFGGKSLRVNFNGKP